MDAQEIQNLSALVVSTKGVDDSIGKLFDEAVRDPAIISVIFLGAVYNLGSIATASLQG
jgi:hypothetical protein